MTEADAVAISTRAMKLWPSFNAEHAAVLTDRLRRMDIEVRQVHLILDEELVSPSPQKVNKIAAVMARLRNADAGGRQPFVAGDTRHGTPPERPSWAAEWAERLGLPVGTEDAVVLEAWARFRWEESKPLEKFRRRKILGHIVKELARTFGRDADSRDYVRSMLNLKADNSELTRFFGPAAQEAAA
jgi:hypothetical protein